ncbi:DUF7619 domain-containing protein [Rufibacter latericius]|uniref:T9SS C-terminal target domain-containing protein n=1 Tax=Rufibacter latericius TaxID=2487040 RepID=A0A3M9MF25_9BACT|nr:T9SS type A sorting domain-containing protein [Rufibacter latericius]RNI23453.1 T9SS C-terminal target domain-containing protein [Rufibacter latericius]
MKHRLLKALLVTFCFLPLFTKAQLKENILSFGGKYGDGISKVLHDKEDNRYVLGVIGTPGELSLNEYQGEEVEFGNLKKRIFNGFVAKFSKDNKLLWLRECPKDLRSTYHDFALDDNGAVFVTGSVHYGHFVLEKIDTNGNLLWEKKYRSKALFNDIVGESIATDSHGNAYVVGLFDGTSMDQITFDFPGANQNRFTEFLAKFGPNGAVEWVKTSLGSKLQYRQVLVDAQDNVITSGGFKDTVSIGDHTFINKTPADSYGPVYDKLLVKRSPEGDVLWARSYPIRINASSIALAGDNSFYLFTESYSYSDSKKVTIDGITYDNTLGNVLLKLDANGVAEWAVPFKKFHYGLSLLPAKEGLYFSTSLHSEFVFNGVVIKGETAGYSGTALVHLNASGEVLGFKSYGGPNAGAYSKLSYMPKSKALVLAGTFYNKFPVNDKFLQSKGDADIFIGELVDTLKGEQTARISGRLYKDQNANCGFDSTEKGLANTLIKIEPGSLYSMSDSAGSYSFRAPFGSTTITPVLSPASRTQVVKSCLESTAVLTDSLNRDIKNVNFGYNIKECPVLSVDIAADRRRRCFTSNTMVTYANEGSADAHNVKIKVIYPQYVVPLSSSLPWIAKQDSALIFEIGTLKAGERHSFVISDSTICGIESIRGLSQCVKAFITPKNSCVPQSQKWDQASVAVAAGFTDQEKTAAFTISNEGTQDMVDSTGYRVYANAALVKQGKVKLKQGASTRLEVPAQTMTYRLEADQVPYHPGQSRPVASIQPSTIPVNLPVNAMPIPIDDLFLDDADAEVDISCLEIVDSFDPNDKQVSPKGITKRHYIKAEDELEYLIRFQNTGTDVAYNVVVKDTISEHLDIASLRIGSASHPFTYTVTGKGKPVITFTFKNINLPDHKANEPGSHGYIKFSIAQNPENPKGTVIRNTAHNYFDFNSPIATNEVVNIIGDTVLVSPMPVVVYDCGKENPTVAQAGTPFNLCEVNQVVVQANAPVKGRGFWKLISGQGTIVNPLSPTSVVQNIGYGKTILEWTITLCEKVSQSRVTINRYQIPDAPNVAALSVQCEGSTLQPLVASGSNVTWYLDAGKQKKLFAGNSFIPVISATSTFFVTQTVNDCESPVRAVEVKINPKQVPVATQGDTLIAPPADAYQWFFNEKALKGETSQQLVVKNSGRYQVKTLTSGCEATSEQLEHTIRLAASTLTLGPNPVQEELMIKFAANAIGEIKVLVRDQLGRKMTDYVLKKEYTVLEQKLAVPNLVPGMYILEVQLGKEVQRVKFVKL